MNIDLARLLTVLGRVNPAIWDVIVPMGPRYFESFSAASRRSQVELNPQPIPPGRRLQFASARVAHQIADAAVAAEAAGVGEGAERLVSRAVDDWCGTPPPHIPIPWPGPWPGPPWLLDATDIGPREIATSRAIGALVLASVASRVPDGEAREALGRGAERLLESALAD
jgi:hypothetical protein